MSDAKQEVLRMIQAKRDKIRNARRRIVRQADVYNTVVDFIKDMEKATKDSTNFFDFDSALNDAARKLEAGICLLDPQASVAVTWSDEGDDMTDTWNQLQVDHVTILWSDFFVEKTGRSQTETIDVGHLFLEGYFV